MFRAIRNPSRATSGASRNAVTQSFPCSRWTCSRTRRTPRPSPFSIDAGERCEGVWPLHPPSLPRRGDRLALFNDVGGEDTSARRPFVGRVMDSASRYEKRLARLERDGRLPRLFEDERALEKISRLFARMGMRARRGARLKPSDGADDFAP